MRIVAYDEADPERAMLTSLVCFGWSMTPETIRLRQKFDKRWADFLELYALDADGRAVSQVLILHIDTATKDGREKVAGMAAVGELPGYSRRGFSTALMKWPTSAFDS